MKSLHFSAFILSLLGVAMLGLSILNINYTSTKIDDERADEIKRHGGSMDTVQLERHLRIEEDTHLLRCALFGMLGILLIGIGIVNATRPTKN